MSAVRDLILIAKDLGQIATDLVKVQADQLANRYKQVLIRVMTWALVLLASLLLSVGGLGMILWGIYLQMSLVAGPVISALVLGAFLLCGAAILFLLARGMLKD
jgi:hypothetical protein